MKSISFSLAALPEKKGSISIRKQRTVTPTVLQFSQTRTRAAFLDPEYDLYEIGKVEDVDSFVRQSFKKKTALMFKEGFELSGPNKDTIRYVKTRMAQIARASQIPTIELMRRVGASLIRTSNAFLVKVRDPKKSGGKTRTTPDGKKLHPVAAYFPAAPETMKPQKDPKTGKVLRWKQELPDGRYKIFTKENVIHFTIDRREGFTFGVPTIIPVIDDIRALRQIEENVELLLYQHLFPLFHYKVGTETAPAGYTEDGKREVDVVRDEIRFMPSEGALVTPERHEIKAVGAEGRALRAENYLQHFKKRVIAGLGISQIDLGDGDTTNRATANTLSRALIDTVKDIQDSFESQWDQEIISELLLESNFSFDPLESENFVHLKFAEIDIQNKMDLEKHASELFLNNAITHDELREKAGLEPIPIPDDPESGGDPSKWPEWNRLNWKLFQEPEAIIKSVDEPWTAMAQSAAAARSLSITEKQLRADEQQRNKMKEQAQKEFAHRSEPPTQKSAPVKKAPIPVKNCLDSELKEEFLSLKREILFNLSNTTTNRSRIDTHLLLAKARAWSELTSRKLISVMMANAIQGFNDYSRNGAADHPIEMQLLRNEVTRTAKSRLNKLATDTIVLVEKRVNPENVTIEDVESVFLSLGYRADFILDFEPRRAYTLGMLTALKKFAPDSLLEIPESECQRCSIHSGILTAKDTTVEQLPPFHAHCKCRLAIKVM